MGNTSLVELIQAGHEVNHRDGLGLTGLVMVSAGMHAASTWFDFSCSLSFEKDLSSYKTSEAN